MSDAAVDLGGGLVRPAVTEDDAAAFALDLYGIRNQDRNFLLEETDGSHSVLRVDNAAFGDDTRVAQHAALEAYRTAGIPVPAMLPGLDGRLTQRTGTGHAVRRSTFVQGDPMVEAGYLAPVVMEEFGALAAASVTALATLDHRGLERTHMWIMRIAADEIALLAPSIHDDRLRRRVLQAAEQAQAALEKVADRLTVQAIHGDLTDDNVLGTRGEDGRLHPRVVIDFGDLAYGWRVSELAVTVSSLLHHEPDRPLRVLDAVEAFHRALPLTRSEIQALWPLVVLRGAILVASGWRQLEIDGDNDYARERISGERAIFDAATSLPLVEAVEHVRARLQADVPGDIADVAGDVAPLRTLLPDLAGRVEVVDAGVESSALHSGRWLGVAVEDDLAADAFDRGAVAAVFPYGVPRLTRAQIDSADAAATWPIAIEVRVDAGEGRIVASPIAGRVARLDGDIVIVERGDGWSLRIDGLHADCAAGDVISTGTRIGTIPASGVPRSLALILTRDDVIAGPTDLIEALETEGPGRSPMVHPDRAQAWSRLTADPAPLVGIPVSKAGDVPGFEQGRQVMSITTYKNPIACNGDFADPFVLRHNGVYYLYATNPGVPVWTSTDLIRWERQANTIEDSTFPDLVPFAPEVVYREGGFFMCTSPSGRGHAVLRASSPLGPFTPVADNVGHSIDGHLFDDGDGRAYFYWAGDEGIWAAEVTSPSTFGAPSLTGAFMHGWTEGPFILKRDGFYHMTLTGNHYLSPGYRIDAAVSDSPDSGYKSHPMNPILVSTTGDIVGLGHSSSVIGPDLVSTYILYHNLNFDASRDLNLDRQVFQGGLTHVHGPSREALAPSAPDVEYRPGAANSVLWRGASGPVITGDGEVVVRSGGRATWATARATADGDFTAEFSLIPEKGLGWHGVRFDDLSEGTPAMTVEISRHEPVIRVFGFDGTIIGERALRRTEIVQVLHTVAVTRTGSRWAISFNGRTVVTLEEGPEPTVRPSIHSTGSDVRLGYTALTRSVGLTADRSSVKPVPGRFPADNPATSVRVHLDTGVEVPLEAVLLEEGRDITYELLVHEAGQYDVMMLGKFDTGTKIQLRGDAGLIVLASGKGDRGLSGRIELPIGRTALRVSVLMVERRSRSWTSRRSDRRCRRAASSRLPPTTKRSFSSLVRALLRLERRCSGVGIRTPGQTLSSVPANCPTARKVTIRKWDTTSFWGTPSNSPIAG